MAYKALWHLLLRHRNEQGHLEERHPKLSFPLTPPPGIFSLPLLATEERQQGKGIQKVDLLSSVIRNTRFLIMETVLNTAREHSRELSNFMVSETPMLQEDLFPFLTLT